MKHRIFSGFFSRENVSLLFRCRQLFREPISVRFDEDIFGKKFYNVGLSQPLLGFYFSFFFAHWFLLKYWHEAFISEVILTRTITHQYNLPHYIDLYAQWTQNGHIVWIQSLLQDWRQNANTLLGDWTHDPALWDLVRQVVHCLHYNWQILTMVIGNRKEEGRVGMHRSIPHSLEKARCPARIDSQRFWTKTS